MCGCCAPLYSWLRRERQSVWLALGVAIGHSVRKLEQGAEAILAVHVLEGGVWSLWHALSLQYVHDTLFSGSQT